MKGRFPDSYPILLVKPLLAVALAANLSCAIVQGQPVRESALEKVNLAEREVEANPRDLKKRFDLAEAMRLSGDSKGAAIQYLDLTSLEPIYYIAYHQLIRTKPTEDQLDEALDRLKKLEAKRPKSLMLRVALSEIFEQKGDLYNAARALIDLQFSQAIPEKYQAKVNARVHYLLSKSRDMASIKTAQHAQQADEDVDKVPVPLPESTLSEGSSAAKLKASKVPSGYGHAQLLP